MDERTKQRFYSSAAWRKLRLYKLSIDPLCQCEVCNLMCEDTIADEVHHIKTIDSNEGWERRQDITNLMSVNHSCHTRITLDENKQHNKFLKQLKFKYIENKKDIERLNFITSQTLDESKRGEGGSSGT